MPGLAAVVPCGGAACIIASGLTAQTLVGKLLSLRPLVFIGLISYSLYLWHWPIIVLARYWEFVPIAHTTWLGLFLLCFALSILTWKYVEVPFRQRLYFPRKVQVFGFAAASTLAVLATGAGLVIFNGMPERTPLEARQFAEGINDQVVLGPRPEGINLLEVREGKLVELGAVPTQPIHLLVWGDSHAQMLLSALNAACAEHHVRGVAAIHVATPPLLGLNHRHPDGLGEEATPFGEAVIQFAATQKVKNLALIANWDGSINFFGNTLFKHGLKTTLKGLARSGCRIWIMPSVPTYKWHIPRMLAYSIIEGKAISEIGMPLDDYQHGQSQQKELFLDADQRHLLSILDPLPFFTGANQRCLVQTGGWSLYIDNHHLSEHGAQHLKPMFEPIFASIAE
jgi:hypothetical protein